MTSKGRKHMWGEVFDVIAATRSAPSRGQRRNRSIPVIPDPMTRAGRVRAGRQNIHTEQEQHMENLIPLSTLSELGSVDQLTHQLGDDMQIDDIGRRCCTRERARELFTERTAALAEQARRHVE